MLYIFGIPFFAFWLDLGMRWLIDHDDFTFENWCYGPDLSLTGLLTGFACLPDLQNPDFRLVSVALSASFGTVFATMVLHSGCLPMLKSKRALNVWAGRILLGGLANLLGAGGMCGVLYLMWKK
ncbi:MAG TPA: hypothetical protein VFE47_12600 [Tepidisphaeraceae bacterium]|jgi:hypothetical protein|nr:hypothetical protein [Tepidisphaeraceae bacterium]